MSKKKQRFIMLCGIPASGKSTVAKDLIKGRDDIVYIASDDLRKELLNDVNNQEKNADIFLEMNRRTKMYLNNGWHVVYDATNISRKKRKGLLQQLPKDIEKIVLYMATPFETIIEQNDNRERIVPLDVIHRMYKTLQIPIYSEGWDKIIFEHNNNALDYDFPKQFTDSIRAGVIFNREGHELMEFLASYFIEFSNIYDMPQDSKWHSLSVSRHTYYVYKHVQDNYTGEDKEVMLWTALLHDIGKHFCKSFKNHKGMTTTHANFVGHEYVGSQMAIPFLKEMNFEDEFIHKVSTLIQFHMYLLDKTASKEKLKKYVGEEMFHKLEFLREADIVAH